MKTTVIAGAITTVRNRKLRSSWLFVYWAASSFCSAMRSPLLDLCIHTVHRPAPARLDGHAGFGNLVDVDIRIERAHAAVLAGAIGSADVAARAARENELLHRAFALEHEHLVDPL